MVDEVDHGGESLVGEGPHVDQGVGGQAGGGRVQEIPGIQHQFGGAVKKEIRDYLGIFPNRGGGVSPIPKPLL